MEIRLQKTESIKLKYSECPMCHKNFNTKSRKKTEHHVIPLLLKPLTDITLDLCEECHKKLNKLTGNREVIEARDGVSSSSYEEFIDNYKSLRGEFFDKKINRGQFGEGLWSNLISFLGSKEETKE